MSTVTRTVLFTDLADYTAAVARSDRAGLVRLLTEHEELVAPVVHRHGGRVVKNLGDSFMCLFAAATDALKAALELQATIAETGARSMRVGLTTGDVEEIEGDAFGDAVNLAARILGKTPAGEVWFGPGTRVCMNASEIPWEVAGRFTLKGIPGEVEISRAVPAHRCWLPDHVLQAARKGRLHRLRSGDAPPAVVQPEDVVLFEGFEPGSLDLVEMVARLPRLNPSQLHLAAWVISSGDRLAWTAAERQLVIGTEAAVDKALQDARRASVRQTGSDTILLDVAGADLHLVISGLALPAVPVAKVVASYSYDLDASGRWVTRAEASLLRVEVRPEGVHAAIKGPGVLVNGRSLPADVFFPLREGTRIEAAGSLHVFRELGGGVYLGVILADTPMSLGVAMGQVAEIGREPNHPGLCFLDRRGQENIRWYSGPLADKARAGGFTLDRALVGRRQAAIELLHDGVRVTPLHDRCPTFVYRYDAGAVEPVSEPVLVDVGDHVIAGTTVVGLRDPNLV